MRSNQVPVWALASVTVLMVLIFHSYTMNFVIPQLSGNRMSLIAGTILGSTGIYILLFRAFVTLYRYYLWRIINPTINLNGHWESSIINDKGEQYRIGKVVIKQDYDKIELHGENYSIDGTGKLVSIWNSEQVWIDGLTLYFTYTVQSALQGTANKTGRAIIILDGYSPPNELKGIYNDSSPAQSLGSLILRKIHRFKYKTHCKDSAESPNLVGRVDEKQPNNLPENSRDMG